MSADPAPPSDREGGHPALRAIPTPETPEQWMARLRSGSADALQKLMDRFWKELVGFASRELGDPEMARDLVQETFIQLWERRRNWTGQGSPRAYLYRILRNQIIDERRRRKVRSRWVERISRRPPPTGPSPDEILRSENLWGRFSGAVAELPERRREIFSLIFLEGHTHEEVAEVLGIGKQTVANQMTVALRSIRQAVGSPQSGRGSGRDDLSRGRGRDE